MRLCNVIEIETPQRFLLNGLWFGPKKSKRVIIWVHGLGSSMFSKLKIADELIDSKTAVLAFNNRGHDKVAHLPHASRTFKKAIRGGAAHERFVDCADDIQGAVNFARRQGVRNIFLAGHSTGCQKSVYWASKRGRGVKGIILLAPMSDYSAEAKISGKTKIARALIHARKLVASNRRHELMPESVWGWSLLADAQRCINLYSGEGAEEIFTYWAPRKNPKTLQSIRIPTLVLLAEKDEYGDRPAKEIARWFDTNIHASHRVIIVPKVGHSFKNGEKLVAGAIRNFLKNT